MRGSAISLVAWLLGKAGMFAFSVILGKRLGTDGLGVFTLLTTLFTVSALAASLGLAPAVLRFGSELATRAAEATLRRLILRALSVAAVSGALAGLLIWGLATPIALLFDEPRAQPLMGWATVAVVGLALASILYEGTRARRLMTVATISQLAVPPVVAITTFLLLAPRIDPLTAAIIAWAVAPVGAILGLVPAALFHGGRTQQSAEEPPSRRAMVGLGVQLLPPFLSASIMAWSNVIILQLMGTTDSVGVLHAATKLAMLIFVPVQALIAVLMPSLKRYIVSNDRERLRRATRVASDVIYVLTVGQLGVVFLLSPWLMGI